MRFQMQNSKFKMGRAWHGASWTWLYGGWQAVDARRFEIPNLRFDIGRALRGAWWWLRQVTGDAAYENYLRAARTRASRSHAGPRILSREEFYLDTLRRCYTGVTRCC